MVPFKQSITLPSPSPSPSSILFSFSAMISYILMLNASILCAWLHKIWIELEFSSHTLALLFISRKATYNVNNEQKYHIIYLTGQNVVWKYCQIDQSNDTYLNQQKNGNTKEFIIKNKNIWLSYHIVKNINVPVITANIIDSRLFFFWIPSMNRVNDGTLAE